MAERLLTGTRIRNRRLDRKLRQVDVAARVGISGSYLNLIEHNRRRIGSTLLARLAEVLEVDVAALEDDAAAAITTPLREAAAAFPQSGIDGAQAEDVVARFPDWAALIAAQHARIAQLTERVEALGNRLTHDTQIAASLHEVISTATAIRSTASILVESPDLDGDWLRRFHGNIDGDSARLAESSQALLGLLDMDSGAPQAETTAMEQAEALLAARGFHLPGVERSEAEDWPEASDGVVAQILAQWTEGYRRDATRLPLATFVPAARALAFDPARLAARFDVPLATVLRRLAQLPAADGTPPMGLACCDAAGVVTFQKPVLDFRLPRSGAACPLWPLYQALTQPGRAIRAVARLPGAARTPFECFAIAGPVGAVGFDAAPRVEAVMLVRPARSGAQPQTVGPGCRVCLVEDCASRRQPSVL
ncbi:helix-turn-helix transcriptional regulator [Thalassorhabdomicrobium marinisediminis]|uniref:XRE family transcriptional regulator n=1 Tax=Thalassorhabdomicrobium marinisediminis TaxID=2170577 RepID=A0A2T7FY31_9RHOB|nr:helix-turn-helix transcriptional regulator [Thalassorhabdomicrobium marinisediminis]PVA07073.1 XRE family transcriptional regulator [Thalassorhabdomicrobium marinisediminis]